MAEAEAAASAAAAAAAEISPMEEPETATSTEEEAAPASEDPAPTDDPAPPKETEDAPQGEEVALPIAGSSEPDEIPADAPDHKRKLEELEHSRKEDEETPELKQEVISPAAPDEAGSDGLPIAVQKAPEGVTPISMDDPSVEVHAKRQRVDGETDGSGLDGEHEVQKIEAPLVGNGEHEVRKIEAPLVGNGQHPSAENTQHVPVENLQTSNASLSQEELLPSAEHQSLEPPTSSRKFEVPNNKVGVLIGKAGETIRILQQSSGAKIQITRDAESDPNSTTRPVELIGTVESINKAEQLIKDVIAEAEAGGSPALVARGFGNAQSGTEQHEIRVPNEKVGMIIGKGGETIKNLQTRSGARVQLIPQHLPEGDASKERTVRVTGNKKQIEAAKEMIKEVMNQAPGRPSSLSGGYGQHNFRPRGPSPMPQWGARAPPPAQQATMGYDYQQRGTYPPQSTQYPQPYSSAYTKQQPPRSGISAGWDQRAAAPIQTGGYDYYGQGGQAIDSQSPNPAAAPSPAPVNYNYGQSQAASYGQPTPYAQSAPTQQNYGHGYDEQKYDNQVQSQQYYGQQPVSSQPGAAYAQQGVAPQAGYAQQQTYGKPAYGAAPQSYGPPRASSQPVDQGYQGPASYGSGAPTQQSYPYGQSAPSQQPAPAYGQSYASTTDGYGQPLAAGGYSQQSSQVAPGYGQGGQPAPAYTQQGAQSGAYGQYPSSQPSYGDQQPVAPNNVSYGGYQGGPADAGYGGNSLPNSGYSSAPVGNQAGYGQAGYGQPQQPYQSGYEQSVQPQSGYGGHPGNAPVAVGYTKGLSPQPGYGGQYDSAQMYGQH